LCADQKCGKPHRRDSAGTGISDVVTADLPAHGWGFYATDHEATQGIYNFPNIAVDKVRGFGL